MPTVEERLAALEKQMAAWIDQQPTTYYTHQYSGEEIDESVGVTQTTVPTLVRPNLFDNPCFQIWQRYPDGQYSGVPGPAYIPDRWKVLSSDGNNANVFKRAHDWGGITCVSGANCRIYQFLENQSQYNGKTLTLSTLYETGTLYTITFTPTGWTDSTDILGNTSNAQAWIYPGDTIIGKKLELGPTQTLAHREGDRWVLNEVPEYGEQLRRCQGYALLSQGIMESVPMCQGHIFVPTPVTMRSKPVIVGAPSVWAFETNTQIPDATVSVHSVMPNGVLLSTTATVPAYLFFPAGAGLSADL